MEEKIANKSSKKILLVVLLCIVVAGASFYGGMTYQKKSQKNNMQNNFRAGNFQMQGDSTQRRAANQNGFTNGEILSKDDKSITLKLHDGGSKIILFSGTTSIMKTSTGTIDDIGIGKNVMITGTTNSDGSITAQAIQLRDGEFGPNMPKANQ